MNGTLFGVGVVGLVLGAIGAYAYFSAKLGKALGEVESARQRGEEQEQARAKAELESREAREGKVRAEAERQSAERSHQHPTQR